MGDSYVYAIAAIEPNGFIEAVKIGMTGNVEKRLRALRTYSWRPLRVLGLVSFNGQPLAAFNMEMLAHRTLVESRLEGEWFEYSDEVQDFLAKHFELAEV